MLSPRSLSIACAVLAGVVAAGGCSTKAEKPKIAPVVRIPLREVPDYLKGSMLQQVDLASAEPARVSGFGLVVNLDGTGDTRVPNTVREYMLKQMTKHGFGSALQKGFEKIGPEWVLRDPRVAIVRVDGFVPPGARQGSTFDVQVSALENSNTASLAGGTLYECDLSPRGGDPLSPGSSVSSEATVSGPIFVNPAYALMRNPEAADAKLSLRYGVIMGRGVSALDRPLVLRLRQPERRLARMIEERINYRFQQVADMSNKGGKSGSSIAFAQSDEAVTIYVPRSYNGDWEHFFNIVSHLYFDASSDFAAFKGQQLAEEAVKPNAPLLDISYCWEALGEAALPQMRPLMTSASSDVAFAAARAAAALGDNGGIELLGKMAQNNGNPFQLNSIRALAALRPTQQVRDLVFSVIDSDQALVRIEAYQALAAWDDQHILSRNIQNKFLLDIVPSQGPPLVFATRRGTPRIAVIGRRPSVAIPLTYFAMNNEVSVTNTPEDDNGGLLTIFYRGRATPDAITALSRTDLAELIERLGGNGPPEQKPLPFNYSQVVALVNGLAAENKLYSVAPTGVDAVAFVLQETGGAADDSIYTAPVIGEQNGRPQQAPGETAPKIETGATGRAQ